MTWAGSQSPTLGERLRRGTARAQAPSAISSGEPAVHAATGVQSESTWRHSRADSTCCGPASGSLPGATSATVTMAGMPEK